MNKKIAKSIVCLVFAGVFSLLSMFQNGWFNSKGINIFTSESVVGVDGTKTVTLTEDVGVSNTKVGDAVGVGNMADDAIAETVGTAGGPSRETAKLANNRETAEEINTDSLSVTFYNFGDGDCTLIKYQDCEILVDIGETGWDGKIDAVKNGLRKNISDGVLDYFIITHGDKDHIANAKQFFSWFNRTSNDPLKTEKDKVYTIKNIIDFDSPCKKGAYPLTTANGEQTTYAIYQEQRTKYCKENNTKYQPIANLWTETNEEAPLLKEVKYPLGDGKATLHLLYNKWYFSPLVAEKYHNCMSICLMVTYGESKILLTGDMEEVDTTDNPTYFGGETNLIENYGEEFFDKTTLFKAAHHGSRSSNCERFMAAVKPQYVMIPCYASIYSKNKFPSQQALDNFLRYTDKIFISAYDVGPDAATDRKHLYHGTTTFTIDAEENVKVECEGRDEDLKIGNEWAPIMNTKWFKQNRTASVNAYVFSGYVSPQSAYLGNCTLVKYGSTDILIDCGSKGSNNKRSIFMDKIDDYCVDGVLELVIVSAPTIQAYHELADYYEGNTCVREGVISNYKIENIVDCGDKRIKGTVSGNEKSVYNSYKQDLREQGVTPQTIDTMAGETQTFAQEGFSVSYLELADESDAICCTVNFWETKMLFANFLDGEDEQSLIDNNRNALKNIVFYKASLYGLSDANTKVILNEIKSQNLHIAISGLPDAGRGYLSKATCERLIKATNATSEKRDGKAKICLTAYKGEREYVEGDGDIRFTILQSAGEIVDDGMSMCGLGKNGAIFNFNDYYGNR